MVKKKPGAKRVSLVNEHRSSAGFLLAWVGAEATERLQHAFTTHGVSPRQFHVLALLSDQGALEQTSLSRFMGLAPSQIVGLLNALEAAGMVKRERTANDRRRHVVVLTATGADTARKASRAHHAAENRLLGALTVEQRSQLRQLLLDITHDWATELAAACERILQRDKGGS